ncbi:hypothetical protein LTR36_006164 [Oleoguttula mirabilis]|uniref:Uncharacterized protein n=1 Tax=Oleoguttula mirabilis TaxID=1507867 RepID=A0AAV9JDA7_9PEZI|nr:hypothetical protein LTR36_006164 [Oleoguttula mirabilis]
MSNGTLLAVTVPIAVFQNTTTSLTDPSNGTIWAVTGVTFNVTEDFIEATFTMDLIAAIWLNGLPQEPIPVKADTSSMHPQEPEEQAHLKMESSVLKYIILGLESVEDVLDVAQLSAEINDGYGRGSRMQMILNVVGIVVKTGKMCLKVLQVLPPPRPPPTAQEGDLVPPSEHSRDQHEEAPLALFNETSRGAAAVPTMRAAAARHPHIISS